MAHAQQGGAQRTVVRALAKKSDTSSRRMPSYVDNDEDSVVFSRFTPSGLARALVPSNQTDKNAEPVSEAKLNTDAEKSPAPALELEESEGSFSFSDTSGRGGASLSEKRPEGEEKEVERRSGAPVQAKRRRLKWGLSRRRRRRARADRGKAHVNVSEDQIPRLSPLIFPTDNVSVQVIREARLTHVTRREVWTEESMAPRHP